jgi:hypothetical protein
MLVHWQLSASWFLPVGFGAYCALTDCDCDVLVEGLDRVSRMWLLYLSMCHVIWPVVMLLR